MLERNTPPSLLEISSTICYYIYEVERIHRDTRMSRSTEKTRLEMEFDGLENEEPKMLVHIS